MQIELTDRAAAFSRLRDLAEDTRSVTAHETFKFCTFFVDYKAVLLADRLHTLALEGMEALFRGDDEAARRAIEAVYSFEDQIRAYNKKADRRDRRRRLLRRSR